MDVDVDLDVDVVVDGDGDVDLDSTVDALERLKSARIQSPTTTAPSRSTGPVAVKVNDHVNVYVAVNQRARSPHRFSRLTLSRQLPAIGLGALRADH